MDKRKYQSKTLIAQYDYSGDIDAESRFFELAYQLEDGSKVIEYSGARFSVYGIKISFGKNIGRKGIYSISDKDFRTWKIIRSENKRGYFIDWQEIQDMQYIADYKSVLKCVGADELPF